MANANAASQKLSKLLDWFADRNVTLVDSIEVRPGSGLCTDDGLGVYATRDIEEGEVLCVIPKSAILSVRNTTLSEFLQKHRLGGGLGLVLAVVHELGLGEKSLWQNYLQSLPKREYVPMFWTEEQERLLQGTDVDTKGKEDREDTATDFETEVLPLLSDNQGLLNSQFMTLENFRIAASWIGSRAFGVDDFHGMAMVPLADIFNHKAALVKLSNDYQLERACLEDNSSSGGSESEEVGDGDSDGDGDASSSNSSAKSEDDSQIETGNKEEGGTSSEEEEEDADVRRVLPAVTAVSRGSMLDAELFPDMDLRLEIGICGSSRGNEEVLEIIAACPLAKGSEVHNTYGELGNAELVSKYGFALRSNPFASVQLSKASLVSCAEALMGKQACSRRSAYLSEQSEVLDGGAEPLEVLPRGQIGPSLLVAARILSCSNAEFARWKEQPLTRVLTNALPRKGSAVPSAPSESRADDPAKRQKVANGNSSNHNENFCHEDAPWDAAPRSNGDTIAAEDCRGTATIGDAGGRVPPDGKRKRKQPPGDAAAETSAQCEGDLEAGADAQDVARGGSASTEDGILEQEDEEEEADEEIDLGNIRIQDADVEWLPERAYVLLRDVIEARLAAYRRHGLDEDLQELQAASVERPRGEAQAAKIAALMLVVSEKEILLEAKAAIEDRLTQFCDGRLG